ncbi:hypothetical protein [Maricaulis sp.]|uniref:hypothetical protein n=1 Tax=Maricaulis sp. TaxID=1486257 RepID=UPI0026370FEB|nr:hypothetical protein [Maricaulis sp.]
MGADASSLTILALLFWIAVFGFPVWRILSRLGFSGFWAILAFVPLVNLIALWVLALNKWPVETAMDTGKLD